MPERRIPFLHYRTVDRYLEVLAAFYALGFFALAIGTYIIHGVLQDTSNQRRKPHRLCSATLPPRLIHGFMVLLIIAEVGGTMILGSGALIAVWQ